MLRYLSPSIPIAGNSHDELLGVALYYPFISPLDGHQAKRDRNGFPRDPHLAISLLSDAPESNCLPRPQKSLGISLH